MTMLRSSIAWTLAGNTVYAGCQWAMLVAVAKLGSAESVGFFALAFALTSPLMVLSNLQLRAVEATDARGEFAFGHYFALRLVTIGAALLVCLLLGCFRMSGALLGSMLLIAAAKAIESVSDILYGLMQRRRDMRSIAVSMISKGVLSLVAWGGVLYLTASLTLACFALACSWALVLGSYDIPAARRLLSTAGTPMRPLWNRQAIGSLAALALPLGVVMGIVSLQVNVPRYIVGASLSVADVGAFAAIASLGMVGSTICNAVAQVVSPHLADDYAALQRRSFLVTIAKLLAVAAAIGAAGVAAAATMGGWLLRQLFRPEYQRWQDVFLILMVAAGVTCLASVLGYALTAARQFRLQVPIYAASLVVTGVICGWLTPAMGLRGAAIGTAAGSLTQLVGTAWALLSTVGVPAEMRRMQYAG